MKITVITNEYEATSSWLDKSFLKINQTKGSTSIALKTILSYSQVD